MRKFRRLVSVFLLCMVSLMSSGFAIAGAGEIEHEVEQSQAGNLPPTGPDDRHCDHGCVGHLSAHLFSASGKGQALTVLPLQAGVVPAVCSQVQLQPLDRFFKPPRTS